MALKYPDRIESNNPQAYGIVKATEVSGAKNAAEYGGLLDIPDNILSASGDGSDALYQLWIDDNSVYRLVDWNNRHNTKGWRLESAYIPWDSTAHLNSLTQSGQYYISGQSNGLNGGLPILNSDPGHTFDAILRVLDSSLTKNENEKQLCITQILSLSNRMGGDGHIFVRTIQTLEKDNLTRTDIESPTCNKWGTWEKLQGVFEKNGVTNIDDLNIYTTNGMYSGIFTSDKSKSLGGLEFKPGDTFLIVTVNGYAASTFGTPQLTQMLYKLPSKKGSGNNSARMYLRTAYWDKDADPKAWVWANWDRLAMASEISGGGGSIEEYNTLIELISANTEKISSVESTANDAKSAAAAAQTAADTAQETADRAQSAADATKSELDQKVDEQTNGVVLVVNTPMAISLEGGAGTTVPSPSGNAGWGYYDAECVEGTKITVSGNGGGFGLWGFVDANGIILSWSGTNVREIDKEIIAPANTTRVIINTYNPNNYPAPKMILPTSLIGQIEALVVKTDKTNYNVGKLLTEKEVSPVFATGFITASGGIIANSSYKYGTFDAEAGDIIIVNFEYISGAISVISVQYPELSIISPKVLASSGQAEYQYLCTEDCKIVISGLSANLTYKVIHSRIDEQIQNSGLPTAIKRVFPDFTINNGSYWTKSGGISTAGGWARTSGAFLKKGAVISLYWAGLNNPYISIITELDEQGEFLRACLLTPNPNIECDLKFVVDKDGYYAMSNSTTDLYKYQIIYFSNNDLFFNPPIDHLFLPTQDGLPREILRSPSFVGIIHKWGFIGDSLSSGEQAVYKDGTSTLERFDLYDYSWGQRLCKLNSVEGFNFSVGGQTTKGWCSGAGERTWAGAQLQKNWKEAYCIALGVNDRSALSTGDADTDINLSDYTQNADTFAGWYAGIIQRLRSVNPKCRIFCITIPYNNQQGYLDNNEVIRAIVPKFNRCYLVDLANYHWTPDGLGLNDHLSPAGYQWAAFEINTYIDWIIRNNMDDFADIAWVGTEYSALQSHSGNT